MLLIINSVFQFRKVVLTEEENALSTISQIEDILISNETELEVLTESLKDEYIIKAEMTAYIWEHVEVSTPEEYQDLAALLNVDEIHIFNSEGTIYEGSEPQYFGFDFNSGSQMEFFKPLLEDKTLTLCQDITPNTAEDKPMMYVATWTSDGSTIVQIGLEPERILEQQSLNELSHIFANMPTTDGTTLFAIDSETGVIVGSSEEIYLDQTSLSIGLDSSEINLDSEMFQAEINGVTSLCVFKQIDSNYIGVTVTDAIIYDTLFNHLLTLNICFILSAIFLYIAVLWIIHISVLRNIDLLIEKVDKIASGNLDTKVDINTSPEFSKLSKQLNAMVSSLLNTTAKMSHVLDHVDTKIAVYEYKNDMKRVFTTRKLNEILKMNSNELQILLEDKNLFEEKIEAIKRNVTNESNIYFLENDIFLNIETISNEDGQYGLIVDVSKLTQEKKLLQHERDNDMLTNLYNRRAFYREIHKLFAEPNILKRAVIIALDMDNLKVINDTYGHDGGDAAIRHSARLLSEIPTEHKILCRLGGDEFVGIIYGEDKDEKLADYIAALEASYINAHTTSGCAHIPIKMSAGYIYTATFTQNYDSLLKYADEALYVAKRSGKSRFVQYL